MSVVVLMMEKRSHVELLLGCSFLYVFLNTIVKKKLSERSLFYGLLCYHAFWRNTFALHFAEDAV